MIMLRKKIRWTSVESSLFNSGGRLSDRSPHSFTSKLEKYVQVKIFLRKQTFLEKFVVQVESTFDNFSKFFAPMLQNVLPTVRKQWRNSKNSWKKIVHSKISFGHIKCSLANIPKVLTERQKPSPSTSVRKHEFFPRKNITILKIFLLLNFFRQKTAKFLISTRKKCINFSSKIKFSTKFFVHKNCTFDRLFEAFEPKCQNIFLTAQRRWKNSWIFQEKIVQSIFSTGHTECSFNKAVEKFYPRVRTFAPEVQNWRKNSKNCFQTSILPKNLPW